MKEWGTDEDQVLMKLVSMHTKNGEIDWISIANDEEVSNRSRESMRLRYLYLIEQDEPISSPKEKGSKWSKEENECLMEMILKHSKNGKTSWSSIMKDDDAETIRWRGIESMRKRSETIKKQLGDDNDHEGFYSEIVEYETKQVTIIYHPKGLVLNGNTILEKDFIILYYDTHKNLPKSLQRLSIDKIQKICNIQGECINHDPPRNKVIEMHTKTPLSWNGKAPIIITVDKRTDILIFETQEKQYESFEDVN